MPIVDGDGNQYEDEFQYELSRTKNLSQGAETGQNTGNNVQYTSEGFPFLDQSRALAGRPEGVLEAGNIDLNARPKVKNEDGSISTVRSMSFNRDGKEILIPTVAADGSGILSEDDAIAQYDKTGQHLGMFDTPEHADAYAQALHLQQEQQYTNEFDWVTRPQSPSEQFYLGEKGEAIKNFLGRVGKHLGSSIVDAIAAGPKLFKDAAEGKLDLNSEEAIQRVTDVAMNYGIAGLATAPLRPGIGMFGGRFTKNAEAMAEKLEAQNFSPITVKEITGLERGADGMWRREFSDASSEINKKYKFTPVVEDDGITPRKESWGYLGDYYKHKELYDSYPEAKNIVVIKTPSIPGLDTAHGMFQTVTGADPVIFLKHGLTDEETKSTLVHEIQHYIQYKEGFSFTNPKELPQDLQDAVKRAHIMSKLSPEQLSGLRAMLRGERPDISPEDQKYLAQSFLNDAEYALYQQQAHEVEAFNVSDRMHMTPKQIKQSLATDTEAVPRDQQIVGRYDEGTAAQVKPSKYIDWDEVLNENKQAFEKAIKNLKRGEEVQVVEYHDLGTSQNYIKQPKFSGTDSDAILKENQKSLSMRDPELTALVSEKARKELAKKANSFTDKLAIALENFYDRLQNKVEDFRQRSLTVKLHKKIDSNLQEFKWTEHKNENLVRISTGELDPDHLLKLGFNPNVPLYKGGSHSPPTEIPNPLNKKRERGFFLADTPNVAMHYGHVVKYYARSDKTLKLDWSKVSSFGEYDSGVMHAVVERAREKGADLLVIDGIFDMGGKQKQYVVLEPSLLRAPTAKFDPNKLGVNHVLASVAGASVAIPAIAYSYHDDE